MGYFDTWIPLAATATAATTTTKKKLRHIINIIIISACTTNIKEPIFLILRPCTPSRFCERVSFAAVAAAAAAPPPLVLPIQAQASMRVLLLLLLLLLVKSTGGRGARKGNGTRARESLLQLLFVICHAKGRRSFPLPPSLRSSLRPSRPAAHHRGTAAHAHAVITLRVFPPAECK